MAKPWRLTRRAEASLAEIARWTVKTFGPCQAAAYEEDLIAGCRQIAAGEAASRDCRLLVDPGLNESLRFTRVGQHFIVFVEDADGVTIIDVLHARSDLPNRLAALSEARDGRR